MSLPQSRKDTREAASGTTPRSHKDTREVASRKIFHLQIFVPLCLGG